MHRFRRAIVVVAVLLGFSALLLAAAFPYAAMLWPLRNWALRAVLPKINGTVVVGNASLGWFSPIRFHDIEIHSPDGEPVVYVPQLTGDRPLWQYLWSPRELGTFCLEQPTVHIVVGPEGNNLSEVFMPVIHPKRPPVPPDVAIGVEIREATVTFRGVDKKAPWQVEKINLGLGLEPSTATKSGQVDLVIQRGELFRHTRILPAMCDDMLQYVAPVLARVPRVSGQFSIELDPWRIPLANPRETTGSGRLRVDQMEITVGPVANRITELFHLTRTAHLAEGSVVPFWIADQRVEHRDLKFRIDDLDVASEGWVGLDHSLKLLETVTLPTRLLGQGSLAKLIRTHPVKIPIRGALAHPDFDQAALAELNRDLLGPLGSLFAKRDTPPAAAPAGRQTAAQPSWLQRLRERVGR